MSIPPSIQSYGGAGKRPPGPGRWCSPSHGSSMLTWDRPGVLTALQQGRASWGSPFARRIRVPSPQITEHIMSIDLTR
jgi:hypothetical protein